MPGKPSRRHFKVETLPPVVVAEVERLITDEHWTYGEIVEHLSQLGHPVSKSSVARYGRQLLAKVERYKETLGIARAVAETGGNSATAMEEAGIKMALDLVLRWLSAAERELPDELDITRVMDSLTRLQGAGVQREKWKAELRKRAEAAGPFQIEDVRPVMFAGVLCHRGECSLEAQELVTAP